MLVTTLAPTTLPCLEKMIFRSVARVSEDSPDTQRLRLANDVVDEDDDDEVALDLPFAADDDLFDDDDSGNTGSNRADRKVWLVLVLWDACKQVWIWEVI